MMHFVVQKLTRHDLCSQELHSLEGYKHPKYKEGMLSDDAHSSNCFS